MHRFHLVLFAALAASATAQPYPTPILSIDDARFGLANLYSLDAAGQFRTRAVFPFLVRPNSFTQHHDDRTLALHRTNSDGVVLYDPDSQTFVRTLHAGAPIGNLYSVRPWHTGDYLITDRGDGGTFVRIVAADGSGVRTVFAQPSWSAQIRAVAQDLETGHILAALLPGPQFSSSLIRIDPATGSHEVLDPTSRDTTALVQDHRDGSVIYGEYSGGLYRRTPQGTITTLLPRQRTNSLAFDRASGNGILVVGGSYTISRVALSPGGVATVVATHTASPVKLAKDLAFERGRNVISVRVARGLWRFELDFAGEAGAPFALLFSASGFTPGIMVGGRTLPLVADGLLAGTVSGALAPILHGGNGTLDSDGRARATLDLRAFAGTLAGTRIWVAAVTADPNAPGTIATISKPSIIVLD